MDVVCELHIKGCVHSLIISICKTENEDVEECTEERVQKTYPSIGT